jgi:hypothetical protein
METFLSRRRCIGLAGGALWLIAISFVFLTWSLLAIGTPAARWILIGSFVLVAACIVASIILIRAALKLPISTVPKTPEEKNIGRQFAWVFGAEMLAFAVVNSVLVAMGKYELLPSCDLVIVGVHFFPLAKIFRVPRYNITALLFCVIPAVTLLTIPKQFEIGQTIAWYVIPSFGCGLVAIVTATAGLRAAWQSISKIRGAA